MGHAFRRCFPVKRDLPPAISDALERLAQLEAAAGQSAVPPNAAAAVVLPPSRKPVRSDNLTVRTAAGLPGDAGNRRLTATVA
ncbi:MAG: hypothetical protein NVSMB26_07130 [Beijerinckiaceae bacterium]